MCALIVLFSLFRTLFDHTTAFSDPLNNQEYQNDLLSDLLQLLLFLKHKGTSLYSHYSLMFLFLFVDLFSYMYVSLMILTQAELLVGIELFTMETIVTLCSCARFHPQDGALVLLILCSLWWVWFSGTFLK